MSVTTTQSIRTLASEFAGTLVETSFVDHAEVYKFREQADADGFSTSCQGRIEGVTRVEPHCVSKLLVRVHYKPGVL